MKYIIIVLPDGDDQPEPELACRKAFVSREAATRYTASFAECHRSRCLIVRCHRGVQFTDYKDPLVLTGEALVNACFGIESRIRNAKDKHEPTTTNQQS